MRHVIVTHPCGDKVEVDLDTVSRIDHFITKQSQYTRIELDSLESGIVVCNETPDEIKKLGEEYEKNMQ